MKRDYNIFSNQCGTLLKQGSFCDAAGAVVEFGSSLTFNFFPIFYNIKVGYLIVDAFSTLKFSLIL